MVKAHIEMGWLWFRELCLSSYQWINILDWNFNDVIMRRYLCAANGFHDCRCLCSINDKKNIYLYILSWNKIRIWLSAEQTFFHRIHIYFITEIEKHEIILALTTVLSIIGKTYTNFLEQIFSAKKRKTFHRSAFSAEGVSRKWNITQFSRYHKIKVNVVP